MSWAEGFYFGQCKLECKSYLLFDIGKTVKVTNGAMTWTKVLGEDLVVVFALPGTNKYTVSLIEEGDESEYTEDVVLGYGEYKIMNIGYGKKSIQGIQNILNAHKEEILNIGDEISLTLSNGVGMVYQIGGINIYNDHDAVFVPKWLYPYTMQMNNSKTNVGGFKSMSLYRWLQNDYFSLLPKEAKELIVYTKQYIINSNNVGAQGGATETIGKIFFPTEWELFGKQIHALESEHKANNSLQWPIFATENNRIRNLGEDGMPRAYWESSPTTLTPSDAGLFCSVTAGGGSYINIATDELGILPCFRLMESEVNA